MKVRVSKLLGWSALATLALGVVMMIGVAASPYTEGESVYDRLIDSVGPLLFYGVIVWLILSALLLTVFGVDAALSKRRAV